jgi:hypothetical protein
MLKRGSERFSSEVCSKNVEHVFSKLVKHFQHLLQQFPAISQMLPRVWGICFTPPRGLDLSNLSHRGDRLALKAPAVQLPAPVHRRLRLTRLRGIRRLRLTRRLRRTRSHRGNRRLRLTRLRCTGRRRPSPRYRRSGEAKRVDSKRAVSGKTISPNLAISEELVDKVP